MGIHEVGAISGVKKKQHRVGGRNGVDAALGKRQDRGGVNDFKMTDDELLQRFESLTLPLEHWRHREHLRIAYLYLTRHDFETAAMKIRRGIQAHNAAHGIAQTPTSGYHETQTMLWAHLVAANLAEYGPADGSEDFLDFHTQLAAVKLHRLYYSKERFMSAEARMRFVAPDLGALPAVGRGVLIPRTIENESSHLA